MLADALAIAEIGAVIVKKFDAAVGAVIQIMVKPNVAFDVVTEATLTVALEAKIKSPDLVLFQPAQAVVVRGMGSNQLASSHTLKTVGIAHRYRPSIVAYTGWPKKNDKILSFIFFHSKYA